MGVTGLDTANLESLCDTIEAVARHYLSCLDEAAILDSMASREAERPASDELSTSTSLMSCIDEADLQDVLRSEGPHRHDRVSAAHAQC